MSLDAAFKQLYRDFQTLRETLIEFQMAIEDKPANCDHVLVDIYSNAADDLLGWVEDAFCGVGQQATCYLVDLTVVGRALIISQEKFNCITHLFSFDLASYERMDELISLGKERQGEWLIWANGVKKALEQCQQPLYNVNQSLFTCWQEIVECAGINAKVISLINQVESKAKVPRNKKILQKKIS